MNTETLLDAIGSVNDCFITALSEEEPVRRKPVRLSRIGIAAAACLCLVIGAIAYHAIKDESAALLFSITAYAKGQDNMNPLGEILELSKPVPIDAFFLDDETAFFLFSYENKDPAAPNYSLIIDSNSTRSRDYGNYENIITGIMTEIGAQDNQTYVFYYPDSEQALPYRLHLSLDYPRENNALVRTAELCITQTNGQYYVELVTIEKSRIHYTDITSVTIKDNTSTYEIIVTSEKSEFGWNIDFHQ